ncbi:hypothetical protein LCL96_22170 [Rossellomorea aquimaris]|nr:hypothetical protein [Rossellomorea aquimaris]MCA1061607.1 hypothetical protein [Rossellomorea aquimaris]
MIGVQDEDSYGKSGIGETPQERQRRGGSPAARGKQSLARKSTAVFRNHNRSLIQVVRFSIEWISLYPCIFFSREDHSMISFQML